VVRNVLRRRDDDYIPDNTWNAFETTTTIRFLRNARLNWLHSLTFERFVGTRRSILVGM